MPPAPATRRRTSLRRLLPVAALLLAVTGQPLTCGQPMPPRTAAGARLFRSLLAADLGLDARRDAEGRLLLVVLYATDSAAADGVAGLLLTPGEGQAAANIREMPIAVEVTSDAGLSAYGTRKPAGVFIADPLKDADLRRIVAYGIAQHVVVYSPFEGHVEKGVLGGLAVEATVQPYLNGTTLAASGITLKPFFLKVAKITR